MTGSSDKVLMDMARDERECAAELIREENEQRMLGNTASAKDLGDLAAHTLSCASELERASMLS